MAGTGVPVLVHPKQSAVLGVPGGSSGTMEPVPECAYEEHLGSDLYVHWPDLPGLILLHPQLSVFHGVHTLQQLIHPLHGLQTQRAAEAQDRVLL